MDATIDQHCPSCGTAIHCSGELSELAGVGQIEQITAEWECPECGVAYEQTTPFDTDLLERTGFHSWVGDIEDELACIVVSDEEHGSESMYGADVVDNEEGSVGMH